MPTKKKKIALVIGAGSVKCAAALGLWKVLKEENIPFDMHMEDKGGSPFHLLSDRLAQFFPTDGRPGRLSDFPALLRPLP